MDAVRQWVALATAAVLAVLAAGWFLLVAPERAEAAALRAQAAEQLQVNAQLQTQLQVLKAKAKDLPKEQAKLAAVAAKIPDNAAQPALLRALAAAADAAGVEFVSVAPGALTPVVQAAAATGEAGAAASGATPTPPAGSAGSLMSMPLTIKVAGGWYEVEEYVAALEELPRALRITGLSLAPGEDPVAPAGGGEGAGGAAAAEDGRSLVTDITGTVYVASGAAPVDVTAVPVGAPAQEEIR